MPAAPIHHTAIDSTEPWNGPAAEKAFDKKAADFDDFYAWTDEGESDPNADGTDKEDGALPHHDIGADGIPGDANLAGVHAAIGALNGAQGGVKSIPESDKAATFKHLIVHLQDAGVKAADLPELKSMEPVTEHKSRRVKPRQHRELARLPEFRRFSAEGLEIRDASDSSSGLTEVTGQVIVYDTAYTVNDGWGGFQETIHYGACAKLLADPQLDVRFLFNHQGMPLARTGATGSLTLTDSLSGLNVTAMLDPRMSLANDLCVALERGLITQMSVGMEVDPAGDVWSGEDDWGMPDVRDIFLLANVFDTSAVTYPASPTTSIELSRMWSEIPAESRERTRKIWHVAKDVRQGRSITQAEADTLMHVIERLHEVDGTIEEARGGDHEEPIDGANGTVSDASNVHPDPVIGEVRSDPTAQDADVTDKLKAISDAVNDAIHSQMKDPDNNTDPVDKKIFAGLQAVQTAMADIMKNQASDGSPDPEPEETKSDPPVDANGDPVVQADADGTDASGGSDNATVSNSDGTGSRSVALALELEKMNLSRRIMRRKTES